jgi:hypothetical protein
MENKDITAVRIPMPQELGYRTDEGIIYSDDGQRDSRHGSKRERSRC